MRRKQLVEKQQTGLSALSDKLLLGDVDYSDEKEGGNVTQAQK